MCAHTQALRAIHMGSFTVERQPLYCSRCMGHTCPALHMPGLGVYVEVLCPDLWWTQDRGAAPWSRQPQTAKHMHTDTNSKEQHMHRAYMVGCAFCPYTSPWWYVLDIQPSILRMHRVIAHIAPTSRRVYCRPFMCFMIRDSDEASPYY